MKLFLDFKIANKKADTIVQQINKKFSFKSAKDIEKLLELVKILYVNSYYDECLLCCEVVKEMEFNGDFRIWGFVHHIWQFRVKLLELCKQEDEAKRIIQTIDSHYKMPAGVFDTPEKAYAHYLKIKNRQTINDVAYIEKIQDTVDAPIRQLNWKFVALSSLIETIIMENTPNVQTEKANEYFIRYCEELKASKKYGIFHTQSNY